jgi:hypothetical protein
MKLQSRFVGALVAAVLALAPLTAWAQNSVATAEAKDFVGTWTLTLESPQGAFEQTLVVKDASGKLAAEVSSQMQPGAVAIGDIAKSGTDLVLKFAGDFQGNAFEAAITLTPDGANKAKVQFDIMNGAFVMAGSGVKK